MIYSGLMQNRVPYRKSEVASPPPFCDTEGLSAELAGSLRGSQPGYFWGLAEPREMGGSSFPEACPPHRGLSLRLLAPAAPARPTIAR